MGDQPEPSAPKLEETFSTDVRDRTDSNSGFLGGWSVRGLSSAVSSAISKITESYKVTEVSQREYSRAVVLKTMESDLITLFHSPNQTIGLSYDLYDIVLQDKLNPASQWLRLVRVGSKEEAFTKFNLLAARLVLFVASTRKTYNLPTLQLISDALLKNSEWTSARLAVELKLAEAFSDNGVLSQGAHINTPCQSDGLTALQLAVKNNNISMAELLLGLAPDGAHLVNPHTQESIFHYAVSTGEEAMVDLVGRYCENKQKIINQVDRQGQLPIGIAAQLNNLKICKKLISFGAKWSVPECMRPPIHMAVKENSVEVVKFILEHEKEEAGACLDGIYAASPLHWARTKEIAQLLLEHGKCDPNKLSCTEDTALHMAIKRRRIEVSYFLILSDCNLNSQNGDGETSLHLAIHADDLKLVRSLLLFGVDPEISDANGDTPALLAIKNRGANREEILRTMQEVGAIRLDEFAGTRSPMSSPCTTDDEGGSNNQSMYGSESHTEPVDFRRTSITTAYSPDASTELSTHLDVNGNKKPRPLRILSLDGGGIRGIVLTKIIQAIEYEAQVPAHELFDVIAGTSTGALFAAKMATKGSPAQCQRLYFRLKDEVFKGTRPYSSGPLEEFLKQEFGPETKMTEIADHKLILTSSLADRHPTELFLFRSYDPLGAEPLDMQKETRTRKKFESLPRPEHTNIWHACRCSSAAPSYFKPAGRFLDGALIANNPTLDVLTEIERYNRKLMEHGRGDEVRPIGVVLSVGTGKLPTTATNNKIDLSIPTGIFSAIDAYSAVRNVSAMLIDAATETDRYIAKRAESWCNMINAKYYRLNSQLQVEIAMDTIDDEVLMQVLWETQIYIHRNRGKIRKIARTLKSYNEV